MQQRWGSNLAISASGARLGRRPSGPLAPVCKRSANWTQQAQPWPNSTTLKSTGNQRNQTRPTSSRRGILAADTGMRAS